MAREIVSDEALHEALRSLPGWDIENGMLHKRFQFASFAEALGWMVAVGVHAERMNHHPDWSNVYNRVDVRLSTHDLGNAISTWDLDLARKMEALAGSRAG